MDVEISQKDKLMRVPKLRFKEFEDDWIELSNKEIFFNSRKKGNSKLPIYSVTLNREMVPRNSLNRKTENAASATDNLLVAKNDIAYNMMRMWQGAFGVAPEDCMVSPAYIVLHPKPNFSSEFFFYYFNKAKSLYLFTAFSYGLTKDRLRLYYRDFGRIKFAVPNFVEQQKISSFLSRVERKIQQLTRKKELLDTYKKGVMQKLFSREIRFKDKDGKDFPEWETKNIDNVLKIGSGKDYKCLGVGEIPVYGTGGIMTYVNDYLYDGESVGIGRKGTIDKPFFITGKFWTVDTLFYTHSFQNVLVKFIYYLFLQINWKKYNEASGVPSLSKKTLDKIKIEIPTIEEQQKIANFLSGIDSKIETVSGQIEKTKTFKKGLLQQMFV